MIPFNNTPFLMVVAFLLLTLAVGIYFSRKSTTFREYAIGNKEFATATLVATLLATAYGGGGLVRTVQEVHNLGLYYIVFAISSGFALWILSQLALRMAPFIHADLSMSESIGKVYGKYPRIITALSSIIVNIILVITQITVMSSAISICMDSVNPRKMTILATVILIFYSTFGGIRAITFTDVLQFLTFSIIIPLLSWFMFLKTGKSVSEIIPFVQSHEKFQFSSVFHFDTKLVALLALVLANLASCINSTNIQRMYMTFGPIQARKVFLYSNLFYILITFFIILIGLFIFVSAPGLPKAEIWNYIMAHIPPIFKGFVSISLLAMTMSTADSCLNTCAVMVSHDIVESVRGVKTAIYDYQLWLARLTSLVVGLLAMIFAFYYNDLLQLLYFALDFSVPIATAPFVLAIFGFRGSSRTALIGMATGILAVLAWNQWIKPATEIDGAFVCMVANGLAMMAAHYVLPQPADKGWVGPDEEFRQIQQARARKWARRKPIIQSNFYVFLIVFALLSILNIICALLR